MCFEKRVGVGGCIATKNFADAPLTSRYLNG